MFLTQYISDIYKGVKSLLIGMKRTGHYFVRPGEIITEQYPDNRDTLKMAERFRGEVIMPHDENNEHACTGCTACELACPNATITMCNLCVEACPTDAIKMGQNFEHSVYDRSMLTKKLNKPGSKIREGVE